ncbi:MAG: hypothetical protein JJE30_15000 [Desulfuromonadales bacterium]|nr:hypothetical protein [Desulfuromonadales bacterium]
MKSVLKLYFTGFRKSIVYLLLLITLFICIDSSQAIDRFELGKIINTIPPNGPFWKYGNVVMRRKTKKAGMSPVVFSHWSHRQHYTCRVCHVDLAMSMRSGDTGITRADYTSGKYCGACHDGRVAFSVKESTNCDRCHMKEKELQDLENQFNAFASRLPLTNFGNGINWSDCLSNGLIKPVKSISSANIPMSLPDKLRNPMKLGTATARSDVSFSHEDHFAEMDCSNCHPDIFSIKKKGTEDFSMDRNIFGNFCGACHMLVAFPMNDCKRCHTSMSNISGV